MEYRVGSGLMQRFLEWLAANAPSFAPKPKPVPVPVRVEQPRRRM